MKIHSFYRTAKYIIVYPVKGDRFVISRAAFEAYVDQNNFRIACYPNSCDESIEDTYQQSWQQYYDSWGVNGDIEKYCAINTLAEPFQQICNLHFPKHAI